MIKHKYNKYSQTKDYSTPELNLHTPFGGCSGSLRVKARRRSVSLRRSGFTIIEVVLVLAIAGLIFLMVFIALPALQRSQRNTEYRNRVSMMITMLDRYKANNRDRYPESTGGGGIRVGNTSINADHGFYSYVQNSGMSDGTFVKVIPVGRSFTLPDYGILLTSPATGDVHFGRVVAILNGECDAPSGGQNGFSFTHAVGKTSVFTLLEEGEYGTVYCQVI